VDAGWPSPGKHKNMKLSLLLALCIFIDVADAFGSVPSGGFNAVEQGRSSCQDIFFGKGPDRQSLRQPPGQVVDDICSAIVGGQRNTNTRFARQNKGTMYWCNQDGRDSDPVACSQAYVVRADGSHSLCAYDETAEIKCSLQEESQASCIESPEVCAILQDESLTPSDATNRESTYNFCRPFNDKKSCNEAIFKYTDHPDSTQEKFLTCGWTGSQCDPVGPMICDVNGRRRNLQDDDPRDCADVTNEELCNNAYSYLGGIDYTYDPLANPFVTPPELVMCEWAEGACRDSPQTCPYACELAKTRDIDVPGTTPTDATETFGDRAIEEFCEVNLDRRTRATVCQNFYRAESSGVADFPLQLVPCVFFPAGNGPQTCTRETRMPACI